MLKRCSRLVVIALFSILPFLTLNLWADTPLPSTNPTAQPAIIPYAPSASAKAYVLMDANSGKILASKDMSERLPPASLTKLMTLYLTFQALKTGAIRLDSNVQVSQKAWQMGGSKMFIRVGTDVPLEKLIQGVIVDSGNDACVALAQFVGGSEDTFTNMMNQQAQLLGMKDTHYTDSTGLPSPDHYTTAYDLALLTHALIADFPEYYHYFSEKWLTYNNITQPNRNRLLWRYPDADGLKTGHTDQAGFCLIGSAIKNGLRLIVVVLNAPTDEARASDAIALLTYGFRFYTSHLIYQAGSNIATPRVWFGAEKTVPASIAQNLYVTLPYGQFQEIQTTIQTDSNLKAPITKGQTVGSVVINENGQPIETMPLIALTNIPKGGVFRRSMDSMAHLFHGWFGSKKKTTTVKITPTTAPASVSTTATSPAMTPVTTTPAPVTTTAAITPTAPATGTTATP